MPSAPFMQLSGKVSEADLNDVRGVVRSRFYWPKWILANWYGLTLTGIILWVTAAGLLGYTHPNWTAIAVIWLVIFAIFGWAFWSTRRAQHKEFSQLNVGLPDFVELHDDGIKTSGPGAATAFNPWTSFKGIREGKRVVLLDTNFNGFIILPVAEVSSVQRESLKQFLSSRISPPAPAAPSR